MCFLKLSKNGKFESLTVKTTYLTHYVSYLNLEGEVSAAKWTDLLAILVQIESGLSKLNF